MRKKIIVVCVLLIALILLSAYILINFDALSYSPFADKLYFEAPTFVTMDDKGNTYIIDSSMRRVLRVRPDDRIDLIINGGVQGEGKFVYARELACDKDGNIYILNSIMDYEYNYTIGEQIIKYDSKGKFRYVLFQKNYEKEYVEKDWRLIRRGKIVSLEAVDGYLYWFQLENNSIVMSRVSTLKEGASVEAVLEKPYDDPAVYLADICRVNDNVILYSTKKGEIIRAYKDPAKPEEAILKHTVKNRYIPWKIGVDSYGGVYFADLAGRDIKKIRNGEVNTVISRSIVEQQGHLLGSTVFYDFEVLRNGTVLTTNTYSVINRNGIPAVEYINRITRMKPDGVIDRYFNFSMFNRQTIVNRLLVWTAVPLSILLFIFIIAYVFLKVMERHFSLILKQIVLFVPIILFSLGFVIKFMYDDFSVRFEKELLNKISLMTQSISRNLDASRLKSISGIDNFMNEDYRFFREQVHSSLNNNRDEWNDGFYCAIYKVIDNQVYGFMYFNDSIGVLYPFVDYEDPDSQFHDAYDQGKIITGKISSFEGDFMYGMGPIRDKNGDIAGIIEIGTDMFGFNEGNRLMFISLLKRLGAIICLFIVIIVGTTVILLKSVRVLRDAVNQLAQGDLNASVNIRSRDEVGELSTGFNKMADYIRNHINEILELNRGYQRFVPEQFLTFLNKQKVTDIMLGDQVQQEMAILFSDIRDFTTISEQLSPKENFDFLNDYLGLMGPVIRENGGFIDKYIGDAIMALFPYSPADAVNAALDIINRLYDFNERVKDSGLNPINIGIGIHTGLLMLGILGESERYDGTVISDSVNLASRIEGLTKQYSTSLIISETVYDSIRDSGRYLVRYLGLVQVKGKNRPIGIYEVLDALRHSDRELKVVTKKYFESGIICFQNQEFHEAARRFKVVVQNNKSDKAARLYLEASIKYLDGEVPAAWDGTLKMVSK